MFKKKGSPENDILSAEYDALFHYALSICKNETDAYDITQETFLKAYKNLKSFKSDSGVYTWLCSIARNIWIDKCRKKKHEVTPEDWEEHIPDTSPSVEQYISDKAQAFAVHRILHTLNDPYKEVFSLRVFGQLSFKEIASIFEETESWARVTYYRAKKQITEKLRKEDNYDE